MKLSSFAKTGLALSILATGVVTTTGQTASAGTELKNSEHAGVNLISKETKSLSDYYNQSSWDFKNVNGYKINDKFEFVDPNTKQASIVKLEGSDKKLLSQEQLNNKDIFVVREGLGRQADNISIGGITKTNSKNYTDYVRKTPLSIKKEQGNFISVIDDKPFTINKEEISLKELDFKLRNYLMKEHGLYKTNPNNSKIVIKMKDNSFYTFELNKKLQDHRMGDVIDSRNIDRIEVEYK